MKVRIKTNIQSNDTNNNYSINGIYDEKNKILKYVEDDYKINIDLKNKIMMRKNDKYIINIDFNNNNLNMNINGLEMSMKFKLEYLNIDNSLINFKYNIDNSYTEYKISWEEM